MANMVKKKRKNALKIRKEKKLRLKEALRAVEKANKIENPLTDLPDFKNFQKDDIKIRIEYYSINSINEQMFSEIFCLMKKNMEIMYNSCSWGWQEEKKYKEMKESSAKYLVAFDENDHIVGFSHFRFDMDYGSEVLYCYELQLDTSIQRKGLGKFLLQILELIAFKNNMKKVVLTVLKHNLPAIKFFYSLK
ncbi:conserved hypothetical protein [Pediculus humanus corporis]|uniref:N-alpha-acetyltransferase 40 n=1 Tax=Pediculus humanus subsp. corporis TaxID=121224 RepID=E0VI31_PEDHC|nr:uncharacterized protein Phum_PHUM220190 [Pediculus humanus corporis]EEB13037.1 conserved hypothetical protein [Pediculus humanus corporis]